uniref:Uncharacterized protein n=1 Tax=Trieres chinensis TaxID=1514140 RepID=A0A7S2A823_TRICV
MERGTDRAVVHAMLPVYRRRAGSEDEDPSGAKLKAWVESTCQMVEFGFINYHKPESKPQVAIFWINQKGDKIPNGHIGWGEKRTNFMKTYLGHQFVFEDVQTGEVLLEHTIEFTGVRAIGEYRSSIEPGADKSSEVHDGVAGMWNSHFSVRRTFTELGFSKGRLPDDVFASMGAFNYNNDKYKSLEELTGVFLNTWEQDVKFIQIPWDLKVVWQTRIKELVEAWAGCDLENTDMYGLRRYDEGARLLTHVDRITTHAASVIINVAQGNLSQPWTVEVHDHADRLHEVVMEPGDIVYYESAKCLHGRNTPLTGNGAYYTNVFSHYRPTGDPEWYLRDNPDGTPDPLIDVGECELVGPPDAYSSGSVQCDDPRIGLHLSPSMFTAKSGEDLFHWWQRVGGGLSEEREGHHSEL